MKAAAKVDPFADDAVLVGLKAVGEAIASGIDRTAVEVEMFGTADAADLVRAMTGVSGE